MKEFGATDNKAAASIQANCCMEKILKCLMTTVATHTMDCARQALGQDMAITNPRVTHR